jgi:glycosyltransferase involved in cell wall biosynthesis
MTTAITQSNGAPLLSICIPAYNGAHFLARVLEALLPQVLEAGGEAEVIIIDDGSSDNTAEVVEKARCHGPVRYFRNPANLGSARNIVSGPVQHATGEFVCVWSQHCLIYPGALRRVLKLLGEKRHLNAIYINFRCAKYPQDWPAEAIGGYSGAYEYLGSEPAQNREVARWEELISARSAACTQSYAHIAKRSAWREFWAGRDVGSDFTEVLTTFPHTCTLAETTFGKPSYYIGEPVLTIYNGAQWWGSLDSRAKVFLHGYPGLERLYARLGCPRKTRLEVQSFGTGLVEQIAQEALRTGNPEVTRQLAKYALRNWHYKGLAGALWRAFIKSECCWIARALPRWKLSLYRVEQYWFRNCRPARWIRSRLEKRQA